MQQANLDLGLLKEDTVRQIFYDVWGARAETPAIQKMINLVWFNITKLSAQF